MPNDPQVDPPWFESYEELQGFILYIAASTKILGRLASEFAEETTGRSPMPDTAELLVQLESLRSYAQEIIDEATDDIKGITAR